MVIDFSKKSKSKDRTLSDKWASMEQDNKKRALRFPSEKEYYNEQADEARQFAEFYKP